MDEKCAGSKGRPGPALRSENRRGSGTASEEYAAEGIPLPPMLWNRNRNLSKAGTVPFQQSEPEP
jgi:hypothetical protein